MGDFQANGRADGREAGGQESLESVAVVGAVALPDGVNRGIAFEHGYVKGLDHVGADVNVCLHLVVLSGPPQLIVLSP